MIQLLLKHGANINLGGGPVATPLLEALKLCSRWPNQKSDVHRQMLELLELLLQHGANPNVQATVASSYGVEKRPYYPLAYAKQRGLKRAEELLLYHSAAK